MSDPAAVSSPSPGRGYRPEVQGLRAIAVGAVVLYHAGASWLPGGYVGVDVFFVISGFLITGGLVKDLRKKGTLSCSEFYARRARRILPAACLTILFTCLGSWFLLPPLRRGGIGWDAVGSALYFENWLLAGKSTDYLASTQAPSPFQHFWSLAVEEQFYLGWPVLLLVTAMLLRRGRSRRKPFRSRWLRPALVVAVGAVGIPSLVLSVVFTARDPAAGYFVTYTRVWELAVGGMLAVVLRPDRTPTLINAILGWIGLVGIIVAAHQYQAATPFPGYYALLPVIGSACVILAAGHKYGPVRLIGLRPFTWLGDISYSYYLWHWPLIVFATAQLGGNLSFLEGGVVALVALLPAWLSLKFVEQPVQFSRGLKQNATASLAIGMALSLAGSTAGLLLVYSMWPPPPKSAGPIIAVDLPKAVAGQPHGAEVLSANPRNDPAGEAKGDVTGVFPTIEAASTDIGGCPALESESQLKSCSYGAANGRVSVALVGDSHAAQWAPALDVAARDAGWKVTEYTKQGCPAAGVIDVRNGAPDTSCYQWTSSLLQRLRETPPDVVIFSGVDNAVQSPQGGTADEATSHKLQASGLATIWRELQSRGVRVVAIRDTPRPGINIPDCLSAHSKDVSKCSFGRSPALDDGYSIAEAAELTHTPLIDLNDAICPTDPCAPIIGHNIVYADGNHMTATYASSLAPRLEAALRSVGVG